MGNCYRHRHWGDVWINYEGDFDVDTGGEGFIHLDCLTDPSSESSSDPFSSAASGAEADRGSSTDN